MLENSPDRPVRARGGRRPPPEHVAQAVVAVVGLGYVGLPTAIALRAAGARIIGIDISAERLEEIRSGGAELLATEQEQLSSYLQDGGFSLTDHAAALEAADLVLVCVPTPVDEGRRPQPVALERACEAVVPTPVPVRRSCSPRPATSAPPASCWSSRCGCAGWRPARTCSWRSPRSASTRAWATTSSSTPRG